MGKQGNTTEREQELAELIAEQEREKRGKPARAEKAAAAGTCIACGEAYSSGAAVVRKEHNAQTRFVHLRCVGQRYDHGKGRPAVPSSRTDGVRDAALDRAAGLDEDDDEHSVEWTPAAFSNRIRRQWSSLAPPKRAEVLRAELAAKFLKRFGVPWATWRNPMVLDPPLPKRWPWQRSRGFSPRARLVQLLDFENTLALKPRKDGTGRFLSVLEYTWISILAGNWPRAALAAKASGPDVVIRAERELMKKAVAGYGQKPWPGATKVRRGPRTRVEK